MACFDFSWAPALISLPIPGGEHFKLCASLKSWYVRAIIFCHPELNERFRRSADGRPLTSALQPQSQPRQEVQATLIEVAR